MNDHCPVCLNEDANLRPDPTGADAFYTSCARCGEFYISRTLGRQLGQLLKDDEVAHNYAPRWVISAAIRNRWIRSGEVELDTRTVETLLETARQPQDPLESINLLLRHLRRMASSPGESVELDHERDAPLVYARDQQEMNYYLMKASGMGLIESDSSNRYRLDVEGWERLRELDERRTESNQAFVAMWFDEGWEDAFNDGFAPALSDAGYDPLRIDMREHNERIDNKIIAEIRRSGLLVADFTGQREGVYFEAGFALGLGIPVIWTCHKDHIDELHFDTRQYNHIVWSTPEDLREQLLNRIEATLP